MKTKIFCDIAEINLIKKFNKKKIVKGFTTNQAISSVCKRHVLKKILKFTKKPISFEVFADSEKSMIQQGIQINSWGKMFLLKYQLSIQKINSRAR